jgi:GT2 family glycosyltransferase
LTIGVTLLSQLLDRAASLESIVSNSMRRLRYQRADLRRLRAVSAGPDHPSPELTAPLRLRGRSHSALKCRANSQMRYDVTLPAGASVTSWVALATESGDRHTGRVEFQIQVCAEGVESSVRRVIEAGRGRRGRWQRLQVRAPAAGPARIVLSTTASDLGSPDAPSPLWGDPCIQSPRPAASLVAKCRLVISDVSLRVKRFWYGRVVTGSDPYALWVRTTEPSYLGLRAQRQWSRARTRTLSLITFVATPAGWPDPWTVRSVQRQSYPGWEWILAATEEAIEEGRRHVERLQRDRRVRVLAVPSRSSRAQAWNAAWRAAHGEFAAIVGGEDVLSPSALYEMAREMERAPESDVLYSDEDRWSRRHSRRYDPRFKPDWSPDLLLAGNYIGRLAMIRREQANAAEGFRDGYEGAEEWDLLLRLSRRGARLTRVARCLYHRDEAAGPSSAGEEAAIRDHWRQLGHAADVSRSAGGYRVGWPLPQRPLVSVVIPNRNAADVLTQCVTGILRGTSYPNRELVIVDNGSTDPAVLELYRSLEREGNGVIVPFDHPFNFSAASNAGAARARGDLLLFLNNDIEIIDPDWMDELVRWAQLPGIGIVGAKLLYPDRTIQHAGVVFGLGLIGHIFSRAPEGTSGVFGSSDCYRNYLGVTGACQMMRREVFTRLGGFDERFRLAFSDIVLCIEAWKAGYRVVYTPHARLVHHESYTRKTGGWPEDLDLLVGYLANSGFTEDPYFHPELNPGTPVPAVRPPFGPTPPEAVREYVRRVLSAEAMAGR